MKKVLLVSLILGLIVILSPFTTRAQDDTEMAWAKALTETVKNRLHPEIFSEKDAWEVLLGEKTCSQNFTFKSNKFKNLYLQVKTFTKVENYSRSKAFSETIDWKTNNVGKPKESEWEINWPLVFPVSISIFILLFSIFYSKKLFLRQIENRESPVIIAVEKNAIYIFLTVILTILNFTLFKESDSNNKYYLSIAFVILFLSWIISTFKLQDLKFEK